MRRVDRCPLSGVATGPCQGEPGLANVSEIELIDDGRGRRLRSLKGSISSPVLQEAGAFLFPTQYRGASVRCWHKADLARLSTTRPLSGAKQITRLISMLQHENDP